MLTQTALICHVEKTMQLLNKNDCATLESQFSIMIILLCFAYISAVNVLTSSTNITLLLFYPDQSGFEEKIQ